MRLILSRKGFDSSAGGVPSPIFPDGRMLSLPIPDRYSEITYSAISHAGESLGTLVSGLTGGAVPDHHGAHLDPDLTASSLPRLPGWRPLFGQAGPAQSHLRNKGVGPGDLFLFFGLFRCVEKHQGRYRWVPESRPRHVIWGWLQIDNVLPLTEGRPAGCEWAGYHPHLKREIANNCLYLARDNLQIGKRNIGLPGAGVFPCFSASQQLTAADAPMVSLWELPGWFHPGKHRTPLSYHGDLSRWRRCGNRTALRSVGRGQEFVLDCGQYPEAINWARTLINENYGGG